MRRNAIIAGLILCAVVGYAGPEKISNPQARAARETALAVKADPKAAVTYATLHADYKAAKNAQAREAVIERVLAKLAGLEVIEAESKAKAKADAVKGKE